MPNPKMPSTTMKNTVAGRYRSGVPPKIRTATIRTVISMENVKSQDSALEMTSVSRGKYTFLIRLPLATSEPMPVVTTLLKNSHGSKPQDNQSANTSKPDGSPSAGFALSSREKTTE